MRLNLQELRNKKITLVVLLMTEIALFIIDIFTPLGFVDWIYYLVPQFAISAIAPRKISYMNLGFTFILMFLGFFLSPEGIEFNISIINRILGLIILGLITYLILKYRSAEEEIKEKEILEKYNKELKEINDKLQQSIDIKNTLFSIISHDLRSPFTALLGFSEYLTYNIDELSDKEINEFSERIHTSLRKLLNLIENLLHWARVQTNSIDRSPSNFLLKNSADDILQLFHINLAKKRIKAENKIDESLKVFADKDMISLVLRNLVANAIKYSNSDSAIIVINATKVKSEVLVSVTDNGCGIPNLDNEKLFSIVKNKSTPGTENEKGTGLGLVLCKEFVEKNGGRIWAESSASNGSVFYFTVPLSNV